MPDLSNPLIVVSGDEMLILKILLAVSLGAAAAWLF
jgi:hypothetical protein